MTVLTTWSKVGERKWILGLLSLIFILIPFQKRFHGAVDSFSRSLTRPDFVLPEYFSTKVNLCVTDLLIVVLALCLFLFYRVSLGEFFWRGPSKYLTLLLFASIASVFFSVTSTYALQYFRCAQLFVFILLFNSIRSLSEKIDLFSFIRSVAWILVIVAGIQSLICIAQYFTQQALGLDFLGEKSLNHFPFPNPEKQRWILDKFFHHTQENQVLLRASGTFFHPNILGGFIFCSTMASLFLFVQNLSKRSRLFLQACLALQLFSLCVAFSRSALIALGASTLLWCVFQLKNRALCAATYKRTLLVMGALLLVTGLCAALFYPQLIARRLVIDSADSERMQYIIVALKMLKEHPLLGVGYNNFQLFTSQFQQGVAGQILFAKVHNIYCLLAAETGILGAGLFLLFLFSLLRSSLQGLFRCTWAVFQAKIFLIATFLGFLFIGCCDYYFLVNPEGGLLFFGLPGLLSGLNKKELQS